MNNSLYYKFLSKIYIMSIKVFGNGGGEDGFSNQCMLISILDYLRKKTNRLTGMSLRQFREDNNITPARWGTTSEFDNFNPSMVTILQELTKKYRINIYLRTRNSLPNGNYWLGEPFQIDGLDYIAAYTDIYIMKYTRHFELLDQDTKTTNEDYIYKPNKINPQQQLVKITQMKQDNIELIKTSIGN